MCSVLRFKFDKKNVIISYISYSSFSQRPDDEEHKYLSKEEENVLRET